jgi:hypothetical protein
MLAHRRLIDRFFTGLRNLDSEQVAACYAPDAEYSSLALGRVSGPHVLAFWRMVCARGNLQGLHVESASADDTAGHARWAAQYGCGSNIVLQVTETSFYFREGRIFRHHDRLEPFGNRRTIGPDDLLQQERMPLLTRLRARTLVSLDEYLDERDMARFAAARRACRMRVTPPRGCATGPAPAPRVVMATTRPGSR